MKLKRSWIAIVLTAAVACAALAFQNAPQYEVLFEKARFAMETKGDLAGAVKLFDEIVKTYPNMRDYAAKSLYYMGVCYEKLGEQQAQKARDAFQRVVLDYPEQTEEVSLAKQKLLTMQANRIAVREARLDYPEGRPSPDKRYVSFIDWKTGGNLAIKDLTTGEIRVVTSNAEAPKDYALWFAFSPDGTKIAYDWYRDREGICELRILDLNTWASRTLLGNDTDFYREGVSWSHDQAHIATIVIDKQNKIGWISTADGTASILTTLGESMPGAPNNVFPSPDDCYVAYSYTSRKNPSNYDIFLVSTDGSGETIPLVEHAANERVLGWIPGRDELLFLSDRSGSWDAWTLPVKKGKPAGDPALVYPNLGNVSPIGFTNDGDYFFGTNSMWVENYVSDFDPETGKLVGTLTQPLSGHKESLDWSPNGQRLAYVDFEISPEGPGYASGLLHISNLQSGDDRKLTCGLGVIAVRWSPHGESLLISGFRKREVVDNRLKTGLYLVDAQTAETRLVADRQDSRLVIGEWSEDGKGIYYVDRDTLVLHDLETGREKKILTEPHLVGLLAVSPDGVLLAASTDGQEKSVGLITVNVSNGEIHRIVDFSQPLSQAAGYRPTGFDWSPDGKYLLYLVRDAKGTTALCRVPRRGGSQEKLWHTDKTVRDLRIRPDGKQLTFGELKFEGSVWVMEGLLPDASTTVRKQ